MFLDAGCEKRTLGNDFELVCAGVIQTGAGQQAAQPAPAQLGWNAGMGEGEFPTKVRNAGWQIDG